MFQEQIFTIKATAQPTTIGYMVLIVFNNSIGFKFKIGANNTINIIQ